MKQPYLTVDEARTPLRRALLARLGHDTPSIVIEPIQTTNAHSVECSAVGRRCRGGRQEPVLQDCTNVSRSALIVSACVVGIPCGNPSYVFSVPFGKSSADNGAESA